MALRDLVSNLAVRESIRPAVHSATLNGQSVDTRGFHSVMVVASVGAVAGSGNTTLKLQESDNNTDWTDVGADELQGTFPAALATNTAIAVGYIGDARYLRVVGTLNSGTSVAYSAAIVLGDAEQRPVA